TVESVAKRDKELVESARSLEKSVYEGYELLKELAPELQLSDFGRVIPIEDARKRADDLAGVEKTLRTIDPSSEQYGEAQRLLNFFAGVEAGFRAPRTWLVGQQKSKIDDSMNVSLMLSSNDSIKNQFGKLEPLDLRIVCREKQTDFYIIFAGHFM